MGASIGQTGLKLVGFFLLLAGWLLVLFALILLPAAGSRTAFVCVGLLIEFLGFGLAVRSHMRLGDERE